MNILVLPLGVYTFIYLAAQRLDGDNELSFFLILIPVWISIIPIFGFIVLNGVTA
jgi:hypothetical protein